MQKVSPFLWFHTDAEAAVDFYMTVFPSGKVLSKSYYPEGHPFGTPWTLMTAEFEIFEQRFWVINGGDYYTITPWVSFLIRCENQEEVDSYWEKLSDGASSMNCWWITDKFWVTWQIVPEELIDMMTHPERGNVKAMNEVMMKMQKIDIAQLQEAFNW